MRYNTTEDYLKLLDNVVAETYPENMASIMKGYIKSIYRSELQNKYSEPMFWIGLYIALASLLCILAMVADLLHGLRDRKFWFPCKYFSVNAAYLTVISVAMKLPVDLSGSMPGDVDQAGKLGSIAFMCTMMANLLPSLAAMDSKELLSNITALVILVITLVVNICIQINTGVVNIKEDAQFAQNYGIDPKKLGVTNKHRNSIIASVYVAVLLVLLIIHVCSSLAILKSKQIIESKYQLKRQRHEKASKDAQQSSREISSVENLQKHLRNYWIIAESGSPQFIAACSVTSAASGVICVVPAVLHTLTMSWTLKAIFKGDYDSDYGKSMVVILIVQFLGVIVGTIAPFCRCFATSNFKVPIKSILNHINIFKVEIYWSSKLSEWKQDSMPFPFRGHKLEAVIHYSRNIIISLCIEFQEGVVVMCKTIALLPFVIMICVLYCFRCLKKSLKPMFQPCVKKTRKSEEDSKELGEYVLQLEDENELAERTLKDLLKSMNFFIRKGEKKHLNDLSNLLDKSDSGFSGVANFDNRSLLSKEYQDCWSLPVVTLTTIAISLPDIGKKKVDSLLMSVRLGLKYVTLVEETLNATEDFASVRKAAETVWQEVSFHSKWLGNNLKLPGSSSDQEDKTRQVIERFEKMAKEMVIPKLESMDSGGPNDDSTRKAICATSMHRITQTILLPYRANIEDKINREKLINPEQLFDELSSMIADIIAACLTNLPQVIAMKCEASEIEKREASVRAAAKLLGTTKKIINAIQASHPNLDRIDGNDLPFLHKWRAYKLV